MVLKDLDGSLAGNPGDVVVAADNITLFNPKCRNTTEYLNGVACSNTKTWIRFAYNEYTPFSARLLNFTNQFNKMASAPMQWVKLTHPGGFTLNLEANQSYTFFYDNAERPTNLTLNGTFYGMLPNDYLIIKFTMTTQPDIIEFDANTILTQMYIPLTSANNNGDWYWDNSTYELSFIIVNRNYSLPFADVPMLLNAYKCRYAGCAGKVNPSYNLPVKSRPANALFWSDLSTWTAISRPGWTSSMPKDNDSVLIPSPYYVVVDCVLPKLFNLQIEGTLEFDNNIDHYLETSFIFINGGQLIIGWETNPIKTNVEIVMTSQNDFIFGLPYGLAITGLKGIGVFGGLDIHGKQVNKSWTRLNQTVKAGSDSITLKEPVDWKIGDEIIITTTHFNFNQTDRVKIANISNKNCTLYFNQKLQYDHISFIENFNSSSQYEIAAAVGLLTRNVKIRAAENEPLNGFRILVTDYSVLIDGKPTFYKGYARISNVQMIHPGQFNLNAGDDSTYGVLFSNLGSYNTSRPSYVRSSSFHDGYNVAIGIFGSSSIPIENNVIYNMVTSGLNIQSNSNIIRRNLIALISCKFY